MDDDDSGQDFTADLSENKRGVASFVRQEDGDGDFILGEDGADFDRVELEVVRSATLQQPEKNTSSFQTSKTSYKNTSHG